MSDEGHEGCWTLYRRVAGQEGCSTVQEGCRTGVMRDMRDAGNCTLGMQDRRDVVKVGCRTGGMQDRRDS